MNNIRDCILPNRVLNKIAFYKKIDYEFINKENIILENLLVSNSCIIPENFSINFKNKICINDINNEFYYDIILNTEKYCLIFIDLDCYCYLENYFKFTIENDNKYIIDFSENTCFSKNNYFIYKNIENYINT